MCTVPQLEISEQEFEQMPMPVPLTHASSETDTLRRSVGSSTLL
jgi:hypothetical protein